MTYRKEKKSRSIHWFKIGAWIIGLAMLLFVGLFFFTDWLQARVERMVQEQSKGVYNLQLYGLQVSPFTGSMSADSLSLMPDYARWRQLQGQKQEVSRTLLDVQTSKLQLRGLNFLKVLLGQDVSLDRLEVQQPNLLMTLMRQDTTEQHQPMHETVKGLIQGLHIQQIVVDSARFRYRDGPQAEQPMFSLQRFNLSVDDFKLDSQSFNLQDRAYYAEKYELAADNASFLFPDGSYELSSDSLYINTEQRSLLAKQVKLTPKTTPASLSRAKGKSVSYMKLTLDKVDLEGLNYPEHSRNNNFLVQRLLLVKPYLNVYKDKQNFENKGSQPLPHELAQQMQTKFLLDTVEVQNGYIRYAELVPKSEEAGNISLQKLQISMRNVSNMPRYMSAKTPAVVHASGLVMGKVKMQLHAYMPLLNKNGYHRLTGSIESGNPKILNPILGPTAFMRFEEGHLSRGSFEVELNKQRARGALHLIYSNLKIELLSKGTGGKQSLGKKILSKLANVLVVKDSNPSHQGEQPRVGQINVRRNAGNSVFSYWVDCLMDGFLSTAGAQSKADKI